MCQPTDTEQMTTIAYKDGVLVADKMVSNNGVYKFDITKIAAGGRYLCASAGVLSSSLEFIKQASKPEPEFTVLSGDPEDHDHRFIVDNEGLVGIVVGDGSLFWRGKECYAIGTGYEFAMGAMAAGATAEEACRIAAKYDLATGDKFDTLTIEDIKK